MLEQLSSTIKKITLRKHHWPRGNFCLALSSFSPKKINCKSLFYAATERGMTGYKNLQIDPSELCCPQLLMSI
jgi:hypothetical protein